jgi:hypothetical protein
METHEVLTKNWCLQAFQQEYMVNPLGRVIKGDRGGLHVDLGEVMDKYPDARATKAGIPTIGALLAKTPPPKISNVSENPSHLSKQVPSLAAPIGLCKTHLLSQWGQFFNANFKAWCKKFKVLTNAALAHEFPSDDGGTGFDEAAVRRTLFLSFELGERSWAFT